MLCHQTPPSHTSLSVNRRLLYTWSRWHLRLSRCDRHLYKKRAQLSLCSLLWRYGRDSNRDPCVTGRYSNQLNYHTVLADLRCKDSISFLAAKSQSFCIEISFSSASCIEAELICKRALLCKRTTIAFRGKTTMTATLYSLQLRTRTLIAMQYPGEECNRDTYTLVRLPCLFLPEIT